MVHKDKSFMGFSRVENHYDPILMNNPYAHGQPISLWTTVLSSIAIFVLLA